MIQRKLSYLIFLLIISAISSSALAQAPSYKNFELEILKIGYGNLTNSDNQKASFTFGSELRYNISDFYSIGLEVEALVSISKINGDNADLEILRNAAFSIDRYLSNDSAYRAFFGLSIGIYESYQLMIRNGREFDPFDAYSSIGLGLRAGYEVGHLRLTAQYKLTTSKDVLNGFSLTAGLSFWGGYKASNTKS